MLAHRLRRLRAGVVPAEVSRELAAALQAAAMCRLVQAATFRRAVTALQDAGVSVLAIKGTALGSYAYPTPAMRPMTDIDLVVPEGRLVHAAEALGVAGFRVDRDYRETYPARPGEDDGFNARWPEQRLGALVEVHTRMEPAVEGEADMAGFWQRARRHRIEGLTVSCLRPEDELLEVCVHLAAHHHFLGSLRWLLDVHMLVGFGLDWKTVAASAGTRHGRWTAICLALAVRLFGSPVPAEALSTLGAGFDLNAARHLAEEQLWDAGAGFDVAPALGWVFAASSARQALGRALIRMQPFRSQSAGEIGLRIARPRLKDLPSAIRRMTVDLGRLRHRVGSLVRGGMGGLVRRSVRRQRRHERLFAMIQGRDKVG